jgi:hypothetical protein
MLMGVAGWFHGPVCVLLNICLFLLWFISSYDDMLDEKIDLTGLAVAPVAVVVVLVLFCCWLVVLRRGGAAGMKVMRASAVSSSTSLGNAIVWVRNVSTSLSCRFYLLALFI